MRCFVDEQAFPICDQYLSVRVPVHYDGAVLAWAHRNLKTYTFRPPNLVSLRPMKISHAIADRRGCYSALPNSPALMAPANCMCRLPVNLSAIHSDYFVMFELVEVGQSLLDHVVEAARPAERAPCQPCSAARRTCAIERRTKTRVNGSRFRCVILSANKVWKVLRVFKRRSRAPLPAQWLARQSVRNSLRQMLSAPISPA